MNTEITDTTIQRQPCRWVLYDGEGALWVNFARRFAPLLSRHSFALAPLQAPWVQDILLLPGTALILGAGLPAWAFMWRLALAFDFIFRPLAPKVGAARAMFAAFLASGLVHDLVLSVPARGGYGLPTAYFLLQGFGMLIDRSILRSKLGLGAGWRGWLFTFAFTAGPAFWLFHPTFMKQVMLPFLSAIGAF